MIAAFAGSQWLGLGMFISMFGSYLALSTLGLAVASIASSGRFDWRATAKCIATFPPFIAILIALATNHLAQPEWMTQIVDALADTLTPLALAAVGYALRFDCFRGRLGPLCIGLSYPTGCCWHPLQSCSCISRSDQAGDPAAKVAMLEAAMPPMLGASIIAIDNDLEPDLVQFLIGIGVPLSMLTIWGWWWIIAQL